MEKCHVFQYHKKPPSPTQINEIFSNFNLLLTEILQNSNSPSSSDLKTNYQYNQSQHSLTYSHQESDLPSLLNQIDQFFDTNIQKLQNPKTAVSAVSGISAVSAVSSVPGVSSVRGVSSVLGASSAHSVSAVSGVPNVVSILNVSNRVSDVSPSSHVSDVSPAPHVSPETPYEVTPQAPHNTFDSPFSTSLLPTPLMISETPLSKTPTSPATNLNTEATELQHNKSYTSPKQLKGDKKKSCIAVTEPFDVTVAWQAFKAWCNENTEVHSIRWIDNLNELTSLKSSYITYNQEEEEEVSGDTGYPRFAALSCLYADGTTSMRWSKKLLALRYSTDDYGQRFPAAMGYTVSFAYMSDSSQLHWKHFVVSLVEGSATYVESCWLFLKDVLCMEGLALKGRGPLLCFNIQETLHPILRKYPLLASSLVDLLDPCIMAWLLEPDAADDCSNLQYLMNTYIGGGKTSGTIFPDFLYGGSSSVYWEHCFIDAESSSHIVLCQRNAIEELQLADVLVYQETPTAALLSLLDVNGVPFDQSVLIEHTHKLQLELQSIEKEAHQLVGKPFALTSPKQLAQVLFEWLQLPIPSVQINKKMRTNQPSTNDEVLQSLVDHHPIIRLLQRHRGLSKLQSTYVEQLKPVHCDASENNSIHTMLKDANNQYSQRIYTRWRHTMTVTGRLSSSNPNLQNIPHKQTSDVSGDINCRDAFVCHDFETHTLLSVDYCQIEMRILAHFCSDGRLKGFFNNCCGGFSDGNVDIYKEMAAVYSKLPHSSLVSESLRKNAKITCLALIYGSGAQMLSKQMGTTVQEASKFRSDFLSFFPEVSLLLRSIVDNAKRDEYVTTIQGRRRYLAGINSSDTSKKAEAERFAVNTKLQGSASDLMKASMLKVQHAIHRREWRYSSPVMLLTLHDELLLECHKEDVTEVSEMLRECMTVDHGLSIPLSINLKRGSRWGTMQDFSI